MEEARERLSEHERGQEAAVLGPFELAAFDSIKNPKRRLDWLAGRLAVKRLALAVLAERGEKAETGDVEVHNREDGSPFIVLRGEPLKDLPVSLSHVPSGAAAATAGPDRLIGVDLEIVAQRPASFVSIFAHPTERIPESSSPEGQTRLWTLKEAVLKLLSLGLSVDLWDVRFPSMGNTAPEFHGRALARWEALGRPEIRCETEVSAAAAPCARGEHPRFGDRGPLAAEVLSVAYTVRSNPLTREKHESVYRDSGVGGVHA